VNLADKLGQLPGPWLPHVIAELNDYQFKVARIDGEFIWHDHADTDEAFLVVEGVMEIDLPDETVSVGPGELYVVPAGVSHRPRSAGGADIVIIEPRGVTNTGAEGGDRTAPEDVWL
jgi:mannose-6-phosphate isomerase-like protein (cupin superfamily)